MYETSLKHRYDSNVECETSYILSTQEVDVLYALTACTGKQLKLEKWSRELGHLSEEFYDSPADACELAPYFQELMLCVKKRNDAVYETQYDTRNYRSRLSANLKNNRIHIFYEEYNYSVPERNEYYLMEYVDGHLQLSIAKQSMFMEEYLDGKTYAQRYKKLKATRKTYESLQEILELIQTPDISQYNRELLSMRKAAFERLQKKVLECLEAIRNGREFVRDYKDIFDLPTQVITFYGLEKEFDCHSDDMGELVANKEEASVLVDGKIISVTIEQLERAFALGFDEITQIAHVLKTDGNFDCILQ